MRIAIIGAGAIGGSIAALLDRGGHDVAVTARGAQLEAIRSDGLRLDGAWGEHIARPVVGERLDRRPELAFVCTKAQDAARAIEDNRHYLDGASVVVVQNGLAGVETADRLLPDSTCIGGIAVYAARFQEPGRISVTVSANTYLGAGDGPPPALANEAAGILAAVMPAVAVPNFTGCQWTKLIVNQVNAMPAITGLSAQETLGDRRLRRVITASMREAVRVGIAAGVRFGSIQGLSDPTLRMLAGAGLAIGQVVPWAMGRRMGAVPNFGSTLQSIRRGQPTEIDYLNGEIVRQAERIGVGAPINSLLTSLVHEVERTGTYFERPEILRRFAVLK